MSRRKPVTWLSNKIKTSYSGRRRYDYYSKFQYRDVVAKVGDFVLVNKYAETQDITEADCFVAQLISLFETNTRDRFMAHIVWYRKPHSIPNWAFKKTGKIKFLEKEVIRVHSMTDVYINIVEIFKKCTVTLTHTKVSENIINKPYNFICRYRIVEISSKFEPVLEEERNMALSSTPSKSLASEEASQKIPTTDENNLSIAESDVTLPNSEVNMQIRSPRSTVRLESNMDNLQVESNLMQEQRIVILENRLIPSIHTKTAVALSGEDNDMRSPQPDGTKKDQPAHTPIQSSSPRVSDRKQPYYSVQEGYLPHVGHIQEMPMQEMNIDQRTHVLQNQPIQILQPTQTQPLRENQRFQSMDGIVENPHNTQMPSNCQDPRSVNIQTDLQQQTNVPNVRFVPHNPQHVTKERQNPATPQTLNQRFSNVTRNNLLRDPHILVKVSQDRDKHEVVYGTAAPEIPVLRKLSTRDSETQSRTSFGQLPGIPPVFIHGHNIHQHPCLENNIVYQTTKTVFGCEDESHLVQDPPEVIDQECQTDEYFMEEEESLYQNNVSDSGIILENKVTAKGSLVALMNDTINRVSEKKIPRIEQRSEPKKQPSQPVAANQEILSVCTLLNDVYKNLTYAKDLHDQMQNSILVYADVCQNILHKTEKMYPVGSPQNPVFKLTSKVSQVAKETPASVSEQANFINSDQNKNSTVNTAPLGNGTQKSTFVLPPEYDPTDSRWTLKYREKAPELMELMPHNNVYVDKDEFKKCLLASNDCRSLTRLLLTEVFSRNALSVCSLSGKPSLLKKTHVRPGLDNHAKLVLLAFVEKYGKKRKWNTNNTSGILRTINTKLYDMRAKFGKRKILEG